MGRCPVLADGACIHKAGLIHSVFLKSTGFWRHRSRGVCGAGWKCAKIRRNEDRPAYRPGTVLRQLLASHSNSAGNLPNLQPYSSFYPGWNRSLPDLPLRRKDARDGFKPARRCRRSGITCNGPWLRILPWPRQHSYIPRTRGPGFSAPHPIWPGQRRVSAR